MNGVFCRQFLKVAAIVSLSLPGLVAEAQATAPSFPFMPAGEDAEGRPVELLRTDLALTSEQYIAYPGTHALTRQQFPQGFPRAMGSGICFKGGVDQQLDFWVVGDRGPNGDGPAFGGRETKIFPVPAFVPAFGVVRLHRNRTALLQTTDVSDQSGHRMSGLPNPLDALHFEGEIPVSEDLAAIDLDSRGVDPEAIACDGRYVWLSDEYGPFVMKIDPVTGRIVERLVPGNGLPSVFAQRRLNRGMELLTYDRDTRHLWGALQSVIDDGAVSLKGKKVAIRDAAAFIRWLEIDPGTRVVRQFAYPVDRSAYRHGETGQAKLGDMTALGAGRFAVIEQGVDNDGRPQHFLFLVETAGATDIHPLGAADLERSSILEKRVNAADWRAVSPLRKRLLLDLSRVGWTAEKAEGLARVDDRTLVLTNDNDYGLVSGLLDAQGQRIAGNAEQCRLSGRGPELSGDQCPKGAAAVGTFRLPEEALAQHVWLIRFARPLRTY